MSTITPRPVGPIGAPSIVVRVDEAAQAPAGEDDNGVDATNGGGDAESEAKPVVLEHVAALSPRGATSADGWLVSGSGESVYASGVDLAQ